MYAASNGHVEVVKMLLSLPNIDVSARDSYVRIET